MIGGNLRMASGGMELQQHALGVHQRLVSGDPTASADMANLLLDTLVERLTARWPGLARTDACYDAAVEVFVTYLADPGRYDPAQSSPVAWPVMPGQCDVEDDKCP